MIVTRHSACVDGPVERAGSAVVHLHDHAGARVD